MPQANNLKASAPKKMPWLHIIRSVLSAAIGIKSGKNQEQDFSHVKASMFVTAGILFVVLFILTVCTVVHTVLQQSTQ